MTKQQLAVVGEGGQLIQRIDSGPWERSRASAVMDAGEDLKSPLQVVPWPDSGAGPKEDMTSVAASSDYHLRKEPRDSTDVKCPWCQHPMSKFCCAAWLCNVKLHQRFH